ncbi:MAG: ankyrin repeat domain-containing protein, partial [Chloroflexota bacterium]|nr:ankyrin repeat domain-containing protein [Chloroflexota bacterium]
MTAALSPIMDALYHGRTEEAERLAAEATPDRLTIHDLAAVGDIPRLEQLLTAGPASVNAWSADGFQPLQLAAFFGRREAVELLLERGAEVNTQARNAFHVAALHAALAGPDHDIARVLIAAGADVNARQQGNVTPLHAAAQNGQVELVRLLLEHGADPTAADDQARTAADFARQRGHTE